MQGAKNIDNVNFNFVKSANEAYNLINSGKRFDFAVVDIVFNDEKPEGDFKIDYTNYLKEVVQFYKENEPLSFVFDGSLGIHGSFDEEFYRLENGKQSRLAIQSKDEFHIDSFIMGFLVDKYFSKNEIEEINNEKIKVLEKIRNKIDNVNRDLKEFTENPVLALKRDKRSFAGNWGKTEEEIVRNKTNCILNGLKSDLQKYKEALNLIEFDNNSKKLINNLFSTPFCSSDFYKKIWEKCRNLYIDNYNDMPTQFALGIPLSIKILDKGIETIVITNGHRHGYYLQMEGMLNLPLVHKYPERFEKIFGRDGKKHYIGVLLLETDTSLLATYEEDFKKEDINRWEKLFNNIKKVYEEKSKLKDN